MKRIVIVGGGLSGTLLAINLLKQKVDYPLQITMVEKDNPERIGVAYSTQSDCHYLNVPAAKMGAFPTEVEHFFQWLIRKGYDYTPTSFVPRKLFNKYIHETLQEAVDTRSSSTSFAVIQDQAIDLIPAEGSIIKLKSGNTLRADKVVLALGNYPPANLRFANNDYLQNKQYFSNSWAENLYHDLDSDSPVLIIGTGLTMVDVVMTLHKRKHTGKITALSTNGYTPRPHKVAEPYPSFYDEIRDRHTALSILSVFKKHLQTAKKEGNDWRSVVDSLRPHTQELWMGLPIVEKQRFMEHLRHLWGVARHRMPNDSAAIFEQLIAEKQLEIIAGRVLSIAADLKVEYQSRGSQVNTQIHPKAIVNCMGPESNYHRINDPLLQRLLEQKLVHTDALNLGFDCLPNGTIIDENGLRSKFLFTIGPPTKGVLWESTAVPEIRGQAATLAALLLS